jgi:hypothetical protein
MKADTTWFLTQWGESLTRKRLATTFDAENKAVESWDANDLAFTGDFQPLNGSDVRMEQGRSDKSDAKVYVEFDEDIVSGDRVVRSGVNYHVSYIRDHEDHRWCFLRKLRNA